MAEIGKLKENAVKDIIAHNMRNIEGGKPSGNEAIDLSKTHLNYSLLNDRGDSVNEINQYRKKLEKEIFSYNNRKDLVHAIEFVVQLPRDCPPEQEMAFYQACHDYICSTLPMGEKCVFVSQVHLDEYYTDADKNIILDSYGNPISKHHLQMMFVPAVKLDKPKVVNKLVKSRNGRIKKDNNGDPITQTTTYEYKLCADQLTKRKVLLDLHKNLQAFIDSRGIHATVLHKKPGDGKNIGLSIKQLKEITAKTGITIDESITIDRLAEILAENRDIKIIDRKLKQDLKSYNKQVEELQKKVTSLEKENEQQRNRIQELEKAAEVTRETEKQSTWGTSSGWGSQTKKQEVNRLW